MLGSTCKTDVSVGVAHRLEKLALEGQRIASLTPHTAITILYIPNSHFLAIVIFSHCDVSQRLRTLHFKASLQHFGTINLLEIIMFD